MLLPCPLSMPLCCFFSNYGDDSKSVLELCSFNTGWVKCLTSAKCLTSFVIVMKYSSQVPVITQPVCNQQDFQRESITSKIALSSLHSLNFT